MQPNSGDSTPLSPHTSRSNGNLGYTYVYNGGSLSKMTYTGLNSATLYFSYDASGRPLSVSYTDANETTTTYYYITNLQGDVLAIVDGTGTAVVQYTYDAWGRQLSMTGTMKWTLGMQNPLRYRGYVYDSETSLYYLQSRYYNPEMGRFLNADAFVATGQGELGNNMFAYCGNNPVLYKDPSGFLRLSAACVLVNFNDGGSGEATLADYINRSIPQKVKEEEQKIGRIYQKTMDAGAEGIIENVDFTIFSGVLAYAMCGSPLTIAALVGATALGFLYGSARGFVAAVRDEYGQ